MMTSDPKQHRRGAGLLLLLAEQAEAFLLVLLPFARAGLGRHRRHRGRQRLSAGDERRRAVAAGVDLQLVARHGG